jgi:hypothetical protein
MDIKFRRGDIVDTVAFGIGVIKDVMVSTEVDAVTIYVQFVKSIGRTHPDGDALKITPDNPRGVELWKLATVKDLQEAIAERRQSFENEVQKTFELARERQTIAA